MGIVIAAISALRWFFYIPAQPWAAIVVIAIGVLVLYGLATNEDKFRSVHAAP